MQDIHTDNISMDDNLQGNRFFSTNTVMKIKAVFMDIFNYIDIPLMINIYRSAKPEAVSAYKEN